MRPDPDRQVLDSLRRLVRSLRVEPAARGLSPARHFVLHLVAAHPGISVNGLAELCRTSQSSVSVVLKKLVAEGSVRRAAAAADRRRATVAVTAAGRRRLARAPDPAPERLLVGLRALPLARRTRMAADLRAWLRACGLDDAPASMFGEAP